MDGTLLKEDIRIIKAQLYSKLKEEGSIINDSSGTPIDKNGNFLVKVNEYGKPEERDFFIIKKSIFDEIFK